MRQIITDETRKKVVCEHIRDAGLSPVSLLNTMYPMPLSPTGYARIVKNAKRMIPKNLNWN